MTAIRVLRKMQVKWHFCTMKGFLFFKTNYISVLFFDRHEKVKSLEGETDENKNENDFEIIYN